MANWEGNQAYLFEQTERIEAKIKKKELYGEYFLIGSVIIAGVIIGYYFTRFLCPVSAREGKFFDVNKFITPFDSSVQAVANHLKSGAINNCLYAAAPITEIECKVMEALSYVNQSIMYVSDKVQHGRGEYWQFPAETLENGLGDCEDYSFLLASLLLALNIPSNRVRVSLGSKSGTGHAWCEVLLDHWYVLEGARGTMTAVEAANGYRVDCYVYKNKCKTINAGRYGLHGLLDPVEALASVWNNPNITTDAIKANDASHIKQMYELIAETGRDTRERTFSFCSKDGIGTTDVNVGNENEVYLRECEEGQKVGDFHTHLDTTKFSVADLINLVSQQNGFSCVGAAVNNKIACLEVNRTKGFDQWQQRLYAAAEEPLELRELLVHSDLKAQQWLDSYNDYTVAVMEFDSVVRDGKSRGYLVDSTVELLRELSNS